MPTQLQFRRGTTAQTAVFTGAVGEVTVDTTQNVVVVHDGTTSGGWPSPTLAYTQAAFNQANIAYAQANTDLSALASNVAILLNIDTGINVYAQAAYSQANAATNSAQAAYDNSNTKLSLSGGTMTGNLTVPNIIVSNTIYGGIAINSSTPLPNLIAQFTSNSSTYVQVNQQNINPNGSADFVVTADVGTDTTFYIDMGMNGSNSYYGTINPLDGYLYVQGNTGQLHGNLIIGTTSATSGLETRIIAGGYLDNNVIVRVNTAGANVNGNIIPGAANVFTLGTPSLPWQSLYVGPGSVHIDGIILSNNNGQLVLSGASDFAVTNSNLPSTSGISTNANNALNSAQSAYNQANAATNSAQSAYNQANAATNSAQSSYDLANTTTTSYNNFLILENGINVGQNAYSQSSYSQANAATNSAQAAYNQANATNTYATSGYSQANAATNSAQAAYDQANATNTYATSGYSQANASNNLATSAYFNANQAFIQANSAFTQANASNNLATYAYFNANQAFIQANSAFTQANATNLYATSGYSQANAATNSAQAAYNQANTVNTNLNNQITYQSGVDSSQNTNITAVNNFAGGAYTQANAATNSAQAAYNNANTKFAAAGGTITGNVVIQQNLTVSGNLTISGSQTSIGANNVTIANATISLHSPSDLSPLTNDDGQNVGVVMHFYDNVDDHAFFGRVDSTGYLTYYSHSSDPLASNNIIGYNLGTIQSGNLLITGTGSSNLTILQSNTASDVAGTYGHNGVIAMFSGNTNGSLQVGAQNFNTGNTSSMDFALYNNVGTDTYGFVDFGIIGTNYDTVNNSFTIAQAGDGYVYSNNSNFLIGTDTPGKYLKVFTGGYLAQNLVATFTTSNLNSTSITSGSLILSGGMGVGGDIWASNIYSSGTNLLSYFQGIGNTQNTNITAVNNYATSSYVQANAAFTQANAATNSASSSYFNANQAFIQANASFIQANAATNSAQAAYNQANASNNLATSAYFNANQAFIQANAAFIQANATNSYATSSYGQANAATNSASAAYTRANTSANSFSGTSGTATPSSGVISFSSTNGITITGSGSTITISSSQNLQSNATPTFQSMLLSNSGSVNTSITQATTATTAQTAIDTFSTSTYRSAKYVIQMTSSTNYHVIEILLLQNGTTVAMTQYGEIISGSSVGTFDASISGGVMSLLINPASSTSTTINMVRTAISV